MLLRVYSDHMNGWGWAMMLVWSLVLIGFLGVAAWVTVHWTRGGMQAAQPPARTARELLDERFARGEIDLDEYQRRRAALEQPSA